MKTDAQKIKRIMKRRRRDYSMGRISPVKKRPALVRLRNKPTDSFYSSEPWLRLRYRVLVKNGRKCMACGSEGQQIRLHIDHIKPRSRFPELQFQESNLQVLCEDCNLGKGNWDSTDWRSKQE